MSESSPVSSPSRGPRSQLPFPNTSTSGYTQAASNSSLNATPHPPHRYPTSSHYAPTPSPAYYSFQHPVYDYTGSAAYRPQMYYPSQQAAIAPSQFYGSYSTVPQTPQHPVPNSSGQPSGARGRKRANNAGNSASATGARKRRKENHPPLATRTNRVSASTAVTSEPSGGASAASQHPGVHGVGPIRAGGDPRESHQEEHTFDSFGSIANKPKKSTSRASDVWYFTMRVATKEKPDVLMQPARGELYKERPKDTAFIACRLCTGDEWAAWKNVEGQTATIREHLQSEHWDTYRELVVSEKLKGWEETARMPHGPSGASSARSRDRQPFSLEGFYTRLAKWVAVDDQSINVIESRELRELLLFLGTELTEADLPHRTKLTEIIVECFKKEYSKMVDDIQNSLGRVSYTGDVWSRNDLDPHLAITAHYMAKAPDGSLVIRNRLIAFRKLTGSHTGELLADVFWRVMKELDVIDRIGMITLDNASNNNTMMEALERRFSNYRPGETLIVFDRDGNRIRCFPHVTNIAVKTGLKYITKELAEEDVEVLAEEIEELFEHEATHDDFEYLETLQSDVVAAARKLVATCRSSGQRREDLADTIKTGNLAGIFGTDGMRVVALLRDVDTRWSSIFLMIDRVLEMYPAIKVMLEKPKYADIQSVLLDDVQLRVLYDIRQFLYVFHTIQEVVSADKTPTLSVVLPLYEKLIAMLRDLKRVIPNLGHVISASEEKLEEYLGKSRKTRVYILAMLINPTVKLQWAQATWTSEDFEKARKWSSEAMLEHYCAMQMEKTMAGPRAAGRRPVAIGSHASRAQASGLARLNALAQSLSSGSLSETDSSAPSTSQTTAETRSEVISAAEQEARDKSVVDDELQRWLAAGVITDARELEEFDLVRFWQSKKFEYSILYRIALDVLPVQASAVPCERVFSSSKETDSLRRSNLSPEMMEMLQILKYLVRSDRLDFMDGRLAREEECSVLDVEPSVLRNFLISGDIEGLDSLIDSSRH